MVLLFSVQGYKKHDLFVFYWHGKVSYDCGTRTEQTAKNVKFSVIKQKFSEKPLSEHFVSDLDSGEQCTAVDGREIGLNV